MGYILLISGTSRQKAGKIELSTKQKKVQRKELRFHRCCSLVSHLYSLSPREQYSLKVSTGFNLPLQDDFSICAHSLNPSNCNGKFSFRALFCDPRSKHILQNPELKGMSPPHPAASTAREPPVLPHVRCSDLCTKCSASPKVAHTLLPQAGFVLQMAF